MGQSIAISAGEASGDSNGAYLARELAAVRPGVELWGAGGRKMNGAGVRIVVGIPGGTIGISESLRSSPGLVLAYLRLRRALLSRRPDLFVPIDYGACNIRLGQIAHKRGIPVVYYFPPGSWRRQPKNAPKLLACGGKVVTPFPWSAEYLSSNGVDARFVGHPLIDIAKPEQEKSQFLDGIGLLPSTLTIGLLPGSRAHETREHLGPVIGCARILSRELNDAQFVVAVPSGRSRHLSRVGQAAQEAGRDIHIRIVEDRTYDALAHSDFLIVKSGTATLEAAILGTPMIIIYRGTPIQRLEYFFRKSILEEYFGMPNIIADRGVCPELLNEDVTAEKLADVSLGLLRDESSLAAMRSELAQVRSAMGEPGAVRRAAVSILEMGGL